MSIPRVQKSLYEEFTSESSSENTHRWVELHLQQSEVKTSLRAVEMHASEWMTDFLCLLWAFSHTHLSLCILNTVNTISPANEKWTRIVCGGVCSDPCQTDMRRERERTRIVVSRSDDKSDYRNHIFPPQHSLSKAHKSFSVTHRAAMGTSRITPCFEFTCFDIPLSFECCKMRSCCVNFSTEHFLRLLTVCLVVEFPSRMAPNLHTQDWIWNRQRAKSAREKLKRGNQLQLLASLCWLWGRESWEVSGRKGWKFEIFGFPKNF